MTIRDWLIVVAVLAIVVIVFDAWRRMKSRNGYKGGYTKPDSETQDLDELAISPVRRRPATPEELAQSRSALQESLQQVEDHVPMVMDAYSDELEVDAEAHDDDQLAMELPEAAQVRQPKDLPAKPVRTEPQVKPQIKPQAAPQARQQAEPPPAAMDLEATEYLDDSDYLIEPPLDDSAYADLNAPLEEMEDDLVLDYQDPELYDQDYEPQYSQPFAEDLPQVSQAPQASTWVDPLGLDEPEPLTASEPKKSSLGMIQKAKQALQHALDSQVKSADAPVKGKQAKTISEPTPLEVQKVLVVHVVARDEEHGFYGADLLDVLLTMGLRHGRFDIFHLFDAQGRTLFSLANMVNPGTLNPESMNDSQYPGVSMFLALPNEGQALQALDSMHQLACHLAEELGAVLRDDQLNVFTGQTLEHYRQTIVDFSRAQMLQNG